MFGSSNILFSFVGPLKVRVDIDSSTVMLVGLLALLNIQAGIFWAIAMPAILFGSIYLHELGHAWGYKVQGLGVERILIYGGGGLCFGKRPGSRKEQELVVASGPLVNILLWATFGLLGTWLATTVDGQSGQGVFIALILFSTISRINLALALFNLLPVQPLDGGKLAHLISLRFFPPDVALRVTGYVGLLGCVLWLPGMIYLYVQAGWILFFIPNFRLHFKMAQGQGI